MIAAMVFSTELNKRILHPTHPLWKGGRGRMLLYNLTKKCFNLACAHGKGQNLSGCSFKILTI